MRLRKVNRLRVLLRPYCWVRGHRPMLIVRISICSRCLKVWR